MKNIIFYSERWLNGGIESLIINIILKSSSLNNKYKIVVGQKETSTFDTIIKEKNIEFVELHHKLIKNPIIRTVANIFKFKKYIKNDMGSIIHINIYNSVGLILGLFIKNKRRVIIHAHNTGIDKENDRFYLKRFANIIFKRLFTNKKYNYFACSDSAAQFCFNVNKILKYNIIKNGIDSKKFKYNKCIRNEIRKGLKISNNTILFGHVGRFVYQKNHVFLIDVFKEYIKNNKNAKLLLIGDGPLKKEIEKKVEKLNLNNYVIFVGNTNRVHDYMSAMDVFLFPSLYEGLGIVLIEAQCSGLRCFSTNKVPEIVKVTDKINFLELKKEIWIDELKNITLAERKEMSVAIKNSGFDILDSVANLENYYNLIINNC